MKHTNSHPTWIGIALAFYAFIAIGIAESGLGVLLPSILRTYHLTTATVTALFLTQMAGFIIAAMTSSLLSSLMGLTQMLLIAAIALTTALIMYAVASHWLIMVACGILFGLGIGLTDAGINTFIANQQKTANLMGVLHAFYGIGALSGPTLATTLLAFGINWRQVYLVIAGVVGVMIIGMLWAVLQRYQPLMARLSANAHPITNLRLALQAPIVLVAGLLLLIYVGTEVSIGNWAYTVQHVGRGIPDWIAGYSVSSYWLGLTLGRLGTGQMVKVLGVNHMIDFSLTLLLLGLLMWWLLPEQELSLPLMGFALAAIFPTLIWSMPQRVPTAIVPAAIGFLASVGSLGAALVPTVIGWIANALSVEVIPVLLIPLAVLMMILHRWMVRYKASSSR